MAQIFVPGLRVNVLGLHGIFGGEGKNYKQKTMKLINKPGVMISSGLYFPFFSFFFYYY